MSLYRKIILSLVYLFIIFSLGCKFEDPETVKLEDIIKLDCNNPDEIIADGLSIAEFTAEIPENATERMVTFRTTTTAGFFIGASGISTIIVIADLNGRAIAKLNVGIKPGKTEITASIGGYIAIYDLDLKWACAEEIYGETSTSFVNKIGSLRADLKTILSRKNGSVSIGTPVEYFAYQLNDQNKKIEVGRFLNKEGAITNEKGIARVTYVADTANVIIGKQITIKMVAGNDQCTKKEYILSLNVIE